MKRPTEIHATVNEDGTIVLEGHGFTDATCAVEIGRILQALGGQTIEHRKKREAGVPVRADRVKVRR